MNDFTLWIVYSSQFEHWAQYIKTYVEQHSTVAIEFVQDTDERCRLYGINRLPCLVALKYNQPFRRLYGKHANETYLEWMRGLNWLNI
jgi:hypothetical protein